MPSNWQHTVDPQGRCHGPHELLLQRQSHPLVSLRNVALFQNGRRVFENTNWQIYRDQRWAILGDNGSGKSTLVRALSGRVPVVEGDLVYHFCEGKRRVAHVSFDAHRVALQRESFFYQSRWNAFVDDALMPVSSFLSAGSTSHLSAYRVDQVGPDGQALTARMHEVVDLLGIHALLDKNVTRLSNGEMRKVLIARGLMRAPRLLILDNPFTGLDDAFRRRLTEVMEHLTATGLGVMVTVSRWQEIPADTTHVLVVEGNRVKALGEKDTVLANAASQPPTAKSRSLRPRATGHNDASAHALVELDRVTVTYRGTRILQDMSWVIHRGEHWALLGPNGSGKTTLLSLILGDNPQAYGNNVRIFGQRRGSGESIWELKRQIGFVSPEMHVHYPWEVSGLHVVCSGLYDSMGLYRHPKPADVRVACDWMQRLEIDHLADVPFGRASHGEQRLLLLARAVVKRPALLILDEPCQGLDGINRARVLAMIDDIVDHSDATLIFVTHDADELPCAITHALRLRDGRVASIDAWR